MKKSFFTFLLCILFTGTILKAQSVDPSQAILGKWVYSDSSAVEAAKAMIANRIKENPNIGPTPPGTQERFTELYKVTTYEYLANGQYIHQTEGRQPLEGTWKISEDKQWLIMSTPDQGERKRKIITISETALVYQTEGKTGKVIFVPVKK